MTAQKRPLKTASGAATAESTIVKMVTVEITPYDFRGDTLDVVWLPDRSDVGVSLRRLCEALPVDPDSQAKRLVREAAKGARWPCTVKMTVHDESGRRQEMLVLPRRSIPMFAATISLGAVREDLRAGITEKLAHYQDECADALADRFLGPRIRLAPAELRAIVREELTALVGGEVLRNIVHEQLERVAGVAALKRDLAGPLREVITEQMAVREEVDALHKRVDGYNRATLALLQQHMEKVLAAAADVVAQALRGRGASKVK